MGRYWSLEECCWVEYSSTASMPPGPAGPGAVEGEAGAGEQIPEQSGHSAAAPREPAFR